MNWTVLPARACCTRAFTPRGNTVFSFDANVVVVLMVPPLFGLLMAPTPCACDTSTRFSQSFDERVKIKKKMSAMEETGEKRVKAGTPNGKRRTLTDCATTVFLLIQPGCTPLPTACTNLKTVSDEKDAPEKKGQPPTANVDRLRHHCAPHSSGTPPPTACKKIKTVSDENAAPKKKGQPPTANVDRLRHHCAPH